MDINDRLIKIMEHEGLTPAAFSRKIGVGDQTVRSVCVMRRNKPSFDFLSKVVQSFEWLDPFWLLTGEGEMQRPNNPQQTGYCEVNKLKDLIMYLKEKDGKIERLIEENTALKIIFEHNYGSLPPILANPASIK